jgi:hypothetical protein
MNVLWTTALLIGLCCQPALAVQTCPAGLLRTAPDSRYSDNGDGTVTDNQTGLMWKQCSEGQSGAGCAGIATGLNWADSLAAGASSSFAGFNDWRLPNVKELASLVERACVSPSINEFRFPSTPATGTYWTSSSSAANGANAWFVYFGNGGLLNANSKSGNGLVRLARGGR